MKLFHTHVLILNEILPLQIAMGHVGFEVFTAVTMKNAVIWDIKTQFVLHR
jgi:hypothetical protein